MHCCVLANSINVCNPNYLLFLATLLGSLLVTDIVKKWFLKGYQYFPLFALALVIMFVYRTLKFYFSLLQLTDKYPISNFQV